MTMGELMAQNFEPPKWVVPDLIPEGLTLLAGPAKIGKSFLCWNLAVAVASGGVALNSIEIEEPRPVVYMALEDPPKLIQNRLKILSPDSVHENLFIINGFGSEKFDNDGLAYIEEVIKETDAEFLIIDTWKHVCPRPQLDQGSTSYDVDYTSMIPVQRFAHDREIAVVLVTHTTKSKDNNEPFNSIQGSMGMQAGCDTMLMLLRDNQNHVLHTTGRLIEPSEYAMDFTGGIWTLEGDAAYHSLTKSRQELVDILEDAGARGKTVSELVEETGRAQGNVSKMLKKLVADGFVIQPEARGRYFFNEDDFADVNL